MSHISAESPVWLAGNYKLRIIRTYAVRGTYDAC